MDRISYLTEACRKALSGISEKDCAGLTDRILSAKSVFIFGVGRSGLVGQTFSIRLVQLGLQVSFVGEMTTPIIKKDDLLILISNTGKTMSVVTTAKIARRIGTHVVSITSDANSNLAKNSDSVILVKPDENEEAGELAPLGTVFEDATLLFFDAQVPGLMKRLGLTEKDMRNNHAIWV